ncbi:MAG: alpha/beta hydrolase-fold protein [Candidatus Eisenbacteria bacterium]
MIRSAKPKPTVDRARGALAILELIEDEGLTRQKVDAFVAKHSFPIVEGSNCTFLFRGEAEEVTLRHWIFGLPSSQPFQHIGGTDLWFLVMEIPACSRVEYKLEVVHHGHGRWIEDPLNPNRARDPFGANSVIFGAGYEAPQWAETDAEARAGTFQDITFQSEAFGDERRLTIYLPARFRRTRQYPLLLVHDGGDYLQYSGLKNVLDNLIYRLEIPELVAVLTYPNDRLREYANDERHARFLTEEVIPKLETDYPLRRAPGARCLMGASFGAVAALSTAVRYPQVYGRLLLQSGSFAFTDIGTNHQRGPVFDPVVEFMNAYRARPAKVAERAFVSCGIYESLIYENRSLVPVLQSTGMDVRFVEARDGHNWENWRDRLREGLSWLFPGPLWMVYE